MYSCCSRKMSMIVLIIIYLSSTFVTAEKYLFKCTNNGNYTLNTPVINLNTTITNYTLHAANLHALILSLYSNMSDYGFHSASIGHAPNTVNGFALCRADVTLHTCRACVKLASVQVLSECPNARPAAIWYKHCAMRYTNDPLYDMKTAEPNFLAAKGSSKIKACLREASKSFQSVAAEGFRVLNPNCNVQYELSVFYNGTRLAELGVPVIGSLPSSPARQPEKDTIPGNTSKPDVRINGKNTIPEKKDDNTTRQVYISIAASVAMALIFTAGIFILVRASRTSYEATETADYLSVGEFQQYDFVSISAATNGFDEANMLGRGGFGNVYKGNLITGEEVAVKRLAKYSTQGEPQFKNEVFLVAKLKHMNLVKLLGFSMEGAERLLIYEFVQNASLDKFIFDPVKRSQLDWDSRYKIIRGIAKGMSYLHEESGLKIIHRDLKASNVMLDDKLNPKISDFGLARLIKQDDNGGSTLNVVGTYGYMAPEYAMQGKYSFKSDVFSFGVLVLEIVSGQRNSCVQKEKKNVEELLTLVSKTWKNWQEGRALNMIDPMLTSSSCSVRDMVRCIHIGLLCVQEDPANRPTIASVALMLSSSTISLPLPDEPAFHMDLTKQNLNEANSSVGSLSVNDISATEIYPR
ncbi:cysteine-rich receptor-like protein kinase 44 isoform X2 [Salvia hispanica]|uniref:cysteine-rich receptor-like protein kinase 44 isoform X2 n=1 Tax=Salvia hispanica TaxID=49212 RepID=UPI0020090C55|nr:cysteine-rich receptor-like protein kinase 44 isoform X2 [Salvia hispanica]